MDSANHRVFRRPPGYRQNAARLALRVFSTVFFFTADTVPVRGLLFDKMDNNILNTVYLSFNIGCVLSDPGMYL